MLKFLKILFILILTSNSLFAQKNIETVKTLIDKAYDLQYSNNDSAMYFAKKAIKMAEAINYQDGLIAAYVELGFSYKTIGNMDSALYIFNQGLELSNKPEHQSIMYSEIASTYKYIGNYDQSISYYQKCINIDSILQDTSGLGKSYSNISLVYSNMGEQETAITYCNKQIKLYEGKDFPDLHHPINNIGTYYYYLGDYENAVNYMIKALKIREEQNDIIMMGTSYGNISAVFSDMGSYTKALEYGFKCLKAFTDLDNKRYISKVYSNIGGIYENMHSIDTSIYYNNKALQAIENVTDLQQKGIVTSNLGKLYLAKGEYNTALDYLFKAKTIKEDLGDLGSLSVTYNNIGTCYLAMNQYSKSLEYLNVALNMAIENKAKSRQRDVFLSLAAVHSKLNNFQNSYKYQKLFQNLNDSLTGLDKSKQIEELETIYQSEKKDREITAQNLEIANAKLKISETELKVSNKNKLIYLLLGGVLSLLFFGLFIMQRNKRKVQQEKDKAIIEEQEKGLVAVFNAQEEERTRIAKDLHDGIGQQLGAVNLNFQALAKNIISISDDFKPDIDKIKKMIVETGTDVRSISHQMMPRALTKYGLIDALEDMIDISFANSKIECEFEHYNMDKRLPQNIEIGLYRIAQELISNIFRHSNAHKVIIQLMKKEKHCILIVQDDGEGIADKSTDGIGIRNMNSRLTALNGELNLESDSDSGTTAVVKIRL